MYMVKKYDPLYLSVMCINFNKDSQTVLYEYNKPALRHSNNVIWEGLDKAYFPYFVHLSFRRFLILIFNKFTQIDYLQKDCQCLHSKNWFIKYECVNLIRWPTLWKVDLLFPSVPRFNKTTPNTHSFSFN